MSAGDALSKKINVFNLIVWLVTIIAMGLISNFACIQCYDNYIENQFIDATVFGYFLILSFIVIGILCEQEVPRKPMLALCFIGSLMYLISAILMIVSLADIRTKYAYFLTYKYYQARLICALIFCLILGVMLLYEFVVLISKRQVFKLKKDFTATPTFLK